MEQPINSRVGFLMVYGWPSGCVDGLKARARYAIVGVW